MTKTQPQQQYSIGMIGLGVMGRNLVLNMADHGYAAASYDEDRAQVEGACCSRHKEAYERIRRLLEAAPK